MDAYDHLFDYRSDVTSLITADEIQIIEDRIFSQLSETLNEKPHLPSRSVRFRTISGRWLVAASLLVPALICSYLYLRPQQPRLINYVGRETAIVPGGNKAILVLANGQRINLTNA